MWERGLKHSMQMAVESVSESLPMWECGLKPPLFLVDTTTFRHSPCGSVD